MVDIACYKKSGKTILLLFLFALIIEIFVFNYRSFSTAGYTEKSLDDSYTVELVGGSIDENGDIIMNSDADYVTLNIGGFGYPLNNIRLDIECPDDETTPFAIDHVCVAECRAYDDALFEMIDENGQSYLSEGSVALIERDGGGCHQRAVPVSGDIFQARQAGPLLLSHIEQRGEELPAGIVYRGDHQ